METIYAHVHDNGFLQSYHIWNYHGEKHPNADKIAALFNLTTRTNPTNKIDQNYAIQVIMELSHMRKNDTCDCPGTRILLKVLKKEDTGWVNETASLDHEKILAEARMMESEVGDLSPSYQIECMKNALGERRGHIKGVGHVVRKPTPEVSSGRQLTHENIGNTMLVMQLKKILQNEWMNKYRGMNKSFIDELKNKFKDKLTNYWKKCKKRCGDNLTNNWNKLQILLKERSKL